MCANGGRSEVERPRTVRRFSAGARTRRRARRGPDAPAPDEGELAEPREQSPQELARAAAGTEAIFTLPNGLLAHVIANADDGIVEESNSLFDTSLNDFVARASVSCSGCHAQGFNPVVDEVGAARGAQPD